MKRTYKLGHNTPKSHLYRNNHDFNEIRMVTNNEELRWFFDTPSLAYFEDGTPFLYSPDEESEKLYNAQPCIYTDKRYVVEDYFNHIYWRRYEKKSLKAMKRFVNKIHNLPKEWAFQFNKGYYFVGKNIKNNFVYKPKRKVLVTNYQINKDKYFTPLPTIKDDIWGFISLVERLRSEGFLVVVDDENTNRLTDMLRTVQVLSGNEPEPIKDEEKSYYAIAYGYGKKIGFSEGSKELFGYHLGTESILWDRFGEFDKWSRCNEIPKNTPIDEVIKTLKEK